MNEVQKNRSEDDINIDEPRLVTGTCLKNLDLIFAKKCLDPNALGFNRGGHSLEPDNPGRRVPFGQLYFNIVGLQSPFTNEVARFGDPALKHYECYFIIDEQSLIEAHKKHLESLGFSVGADIESMKAFLQTQRTNLRDAILSIIDPKQYSVSYDLMHGDTYNQNGKIQHASDGLNNLLANPNHMFGDNHIGIDLLVELKNARDHKVVDNNVVPFKAFNAGGITTTHSLPLSGIRAIVLPPLESMEEYKRVSEIQNTQSAVSRIKELYEKYGVYIPVYDFENNRLL